jgi:hypothetical protein
VQRHGAYSAGQVNESRTQATLREPNPPRTSNRNKCGPLAFIFGPLLDRQMNEGFNGFIDSLEPAAQARATT